MSTEDFDRPMFYADMLATSALKHKDGGKPFDEDCAVIRSMIGDNPDDLWSIAVAASCVAAAMYSLHGRDRALEILAEFTTGYMAQGGEL